MRTATKNTPEMTRCLRQLAGCYGIEPFYKDGTGKSHTVPDSTLQKAVVLPWCACV